MTQGQNTQGKLSNLITWCKDHGAIIDPRLSFEYSLEKGISTLYKPDSDLDRHNQDTLSFSISIPRELILVSSDARSFFDHLVPGFHSDLTSAALFKAFLGYKLSQNEAEQNPYFQILPRANEIRSPLGYNDEELALLKGTNLYRGTQVKLSQLQSEYKILTEELSRSDSDMHIIDFDHFLWGHLILSSRSFPYKLVDKDADPSSVMMVPLIDLMNHEPMGRVTWGYEESTGFTVQVDEGGKSGSTEIEICNNYGPKGNEELLVGYGFVIPDNQFDCLQLSLSEGSLRGMIGDAKLADWGISHLPRLEDYTYSVVSEDADVGDNDSSRDPFIVFMCNRDHPIPDGLLELFALISRNPEDESVTLKGELNGINKLRASLDSRFKDKLDKMPAMTEGVSQLNYENCRIYREGQLKVYNLVKKTLKEREKELLKKNRKRLISIKDILKKDREQFEPFLKLYQLEDGDGLNKFQMELLVHIWLMKVVNYESEDSVLSTGWIKDEFRRLKEEEVKVEHDPFLVDLYKQAIVPLLDNEDLRSLAEGHNWDVESFLLVDLVYQRNSYEKGSKLEPILIVPSTGGR
ncbi:DEKNAAC102070 [Brettanomyces naardenensis]|uniref:DEKNAAC102070 n=1 Tax=Brettanomyces naardenensis TaxID=13370 RepID=A0A448YJU2_BRENA|nr:DEKNAAC102070 [Brettanomyces naardenensis]